MSRSRARLAADWFAKLRQNEVTNVVEHTDVVAAESDIQAQLDAKASTTTQSTATWQAGTGITQSLVSPANVKSAIAALAEGGATELISTVNCAGATEVVFTGLSTSLYSKYVFVLGYVLPTTDTRIIRADLSTNNGSTWEGTYYIDGGTSSSMELTTPVSSGVDKYVGNFGGEAGYTGQVQLYLSSNNSRRTYVDWAGTWFAYTGDLQNTISGASTSTNNNYNAIKFYFNSGTIQSGTISMYGVKK